MTFNEYQEFSDSYRRYPGKSDLAIESLFYPCLGLAGEVGEVFEHIKKHIRDGRRIDVEEIKLELGDVLWYLTDVGRKFGLKLEDIAKANVDKLEERRQRDLRKAANYTNI